MLQQKSCSGNVEIPGGRGGHQSPPWNRNSEGVGGVQTKNLPWEGYGYFLEPHIRRLVAVLSEHTRRGKINCQKSEAIFAGVTKMIASNFHGIAVTFNRQSLTCQTSVAN